VFAFFPEQKTDSNNKDEVESMDVEEEANNLADKTKEKLTELEGESEKPEDKFEDTTFIDKETAKLKAFAKEVYDGLKDALGHKKKTRHSPSKQC